MTQLHRIFLIISSLFALIIFGALAFLPAPINPMWHFFNGYYRYDPRQEAPPSGLVVDRPEDSLKYYLDATLAACGNRYPVVSNKQVSGYEVETVEYFGKTTYHAFSNVHTRLMFDDGTSTPVTFRFEAGHNEGDIWYFDFGSTVRAGSWFAVGGLVESAAAPPPGWRNTSAGAYRCQDAGRPFEIGR